MTRRTRFGFGAVLAAASLVLVACAPAPAGDGGTQSEACVRMVTNSGGLEDRSFNQSSWEGLQQAQTEYGIEAEAIVSTGETDLAPNVQQAVDSGCGLVVTVGWELAEATTDQAGKNPDLAFAIVDETVEGDNIKPVVFDTAQAAFLAGYLAAGVSKTGVVATFGGGNQPPVTLFMDGFADGVAKYNEVHGATVRLLGWDKAAQDGAFTGDFEDINKGKALTEGFIDQGADVILPVAGQVGEGAASAAVERGGVSVIWVDSDGYETLAAQYRPVILTSVLKNTQDAMVQIVGEVLDDAFTNEPYVGTLENGGVEIAPYHDLAPLVSTELDAEIDGLRQQIISGELEITSPSAP
ncbi:BMP family protein [Agromyces mediolanus]|uniref:BMP family ABC transporter substrate-binding protein n=1 Tax=Agromyces mediolanus TaxID=41986 RepID=A0A918FF40_AGRME|nr:BMP family ABC transporter substrate-binding protein [Agromyces mediolanus]GGR34038.1 BMP family ABC transporter substrate-binding protein [Agromyces mediolanus]GLJ74056.1 BMP family ABC transporter substrate-binding protein [Agromyces mediolanus]